MMVIGRIGVGRPMPRYPRLGVLSRIVSVISDSGSPPERNDDMLRELGFKV